MSRPLDLKRREDQGGSFTLDLETSVVHCQRKTKRLIVAIRGRRQSADGRSYGNPHTDVETPAVGPRAGVRTRAKDCGAR